MKRSTFSSPFLLAAVPALALLFVAQMACGTAAAGTPVPDPTVDSPLATTAGDDTAVFAGGCFWGIEAVFQHLKGVKSSVSGYSGGQSNAPTYEEVSTGSTGHAESVQVIYDTSKISYGTLLKVFFSVAHDPTELNRQGPDAGTQYRSAIFYRTDEQKRVAEAYIDQLTKAKTFSGKIVTQVAKLTKFFPAEEHHQDFLERNPTQRYIVMYDMPKLAELKKRFPELYKE